MGRSSPEAGVRDFDFAIRLGGREILRKMAWFEVLCSFGYKRGKVWATEDDAAAGWL